MCYRLSGHVEFANLHSQQSALPNEYCFSRLYINMITQTEMKGILEYLMVTFNFT